MNKEIFSSVYKNKVLFLIIKKKIRWIHKKHYRDYNKLNWKQLKDSPIVLSQYGYLDMLMLHYQTLKYNSHLLYMCILNASRYGHLNILECIYKDYPKLRSIHLYSSSSDICNIFGKALHGGQLPIIEYIYSLNKEIGNLKDCFYLTGLSRKVEVCQWFINHFKVDNRNVINDFFRNAALTGDLDVLKWGAQNFKILVDDSIWISAIQSCNIEILDFIYEHLLRKNTISSEFIYDAIKYGNVKVVDWIFSKNDTYDIKRILDAILKRDNLELANNIRIILNISIGSHKNEAEWFFEICKELHGYNAIDCAIQKGNYSIMKWIYENTNFQGTINPFIYYQVDRSLDILKWYTENGRPETIPNTTLSQLLENPVYLKMVKYIIRNRTEQFEDVISIYKRNVMDYILLHTQSLELAEWILKNKNLTCSSASMTDAISRDRLEVVKWIHQNTGIKCTNSGLNSAYYLKDSKMIEWLHQNRSEELTQLSTESSYYIQDILNRFSNLSPQVQLYIIHNKPELIPSNILELYKNNTPILQFIIDNYPNQFIDDNSLETVIKIRNFEILKYLHEYYKKHDLNQDTNHFNLYSFKQSLKYAIEYNLDINFIKYLCENGPIIKKRTGNKLFDQPMLVACKGGSLEIVKYLQEHTPYKLNSDHMNLLCSNGYLELVRWVYENHGFKCSDSGLETAARNGHFPVVRYLVENKHDLTSKMFEKAIQKSDLEFVKICLEYQCKHEFNPVDLASSCESLEVLKYLVKNGHQGTNNAIDTASEKGYLKIIIFLRENHYKCTSKSIQSAIDNSHDSVVNWLLNNIEFPSKAISTDHIRSNTIRKFVMEYKNKQKMKELEKDKENNKKRESNDDVIEKRNEKKIKK